ncbi:MAG: ATP-grasp domain-containing protein [Treponemataceae bacterium]
MKKNILILGAGLMQKPAIQAAKELNCNVYVVDADSEAPCVSLADRFCKIDLKDTAGLLSYALSISKKSHLDAVFTAGTDFSANTAYIAQKLSLPGHSYEAALNASDKVRMRNCFKKFGVSSPHFTEINGQNLQLVFSNCRYFLESNGFSIDNFPYVVKPCDNMGARGCRMVNSLEEVLPAVQNAVKYSRTNRAILEQYMDGREFSIDALVCNGKVTITGFAERHIFYPPYFIEMGHTMSAVLSDFEYKILKTEFEKGVFALGLTHGAAKGDIKLTSKGAMIGEIAARLSGGYMSGWTFPYASGINLTKQAILLSLGMESEVCTVAKDIEPKKTSSERAWISIPGVVSKIYGYEKAKNIHGIIDVLPRVKENDEVNFPLNNVEKCGNVISVDPDRQKSVTNAQSAVSSIILRLKPDVTQTNEFLEKDLKTDFPPSAYPNGLEDKNAVDWNYRTIEDTLKIFSDITGFSPNNDPKFWRYLLRGGIQGALYYYDSLKGTI